MPKNWHRKARTEVKQNFRDHAATCSNSVCCSSSRHSKLTMYCFRCIGCLVCSILHDFFRCDLTTSRVSKKKLVLKQDFNPLPDIDPPNPRALEACSSPRPTSGAKNKLAQDIAMVHRYPQIRWVLATSCYIFHHRMDDYIWINQAPRQWQSILGQDFCMLR